MHQVARSVLALTEALPPRTDLGGKGAALAQLVRTGAPVPATAVISTTAYREVVRDPALAAFLNQVAKADSPPVREDVDRAFLEVPLDSALADEILTTARSLGPRVAVRSSASAEDLGSISFAGQYQSYLDVPTAGDDLLRSVRLVWASLWHPAPWAYRRAWAVPDDDVAMAVVLMAMVPAVEAGVAFTVDPEGAPDHLRIEVVEGLADSLVSGARTPTVWLLPRDANTSVPDGAPRELATVRALSLQLEDEAGVSLDIEWAYDGETTWIVQSRPITVHADEGDGFDSGPSDDELTTAGIEEMLPGVLPPLRWEVNAFLVEEALRGTLHPLGALSAPVVAERRFVRRVRGRAALDLDLLKEAAQAIPGGSAAAIEQQYFGASTEQDPPSRGGRLRSIVQQARTALTHRTATTEAELVIGATGELLAVPPVLSDLTTAGLLAYRHRVLDVASRGMTAELAVAAAAGAAYARLEDVLTEHLDASRAATWTQLVTRGAGVAHAIAPSASRAVFAGPTWSESGDRPPSRPPATGNTAFDDLAAELRADPRWHRRRILTGQVVDIRMHLLRRLVNDAIEDLSRREQTKAAVLALGGEVRRVHLELGARLVGQGKLDTAEDVELLSTAELIGALGGTPVAPALIARRRRAIERWRAEGPLPPRFRGMPQQAIEHIAEGTAFTGRAASPGRFTGPAVALRDPSERFPDGAVLVATATDASWSPVFLRAGAVVVERGGPLSHAAIVARELGLPAVLDVAGATGALDGHMVTVDGTAGTVSIETEVDT